MSTADLHPEGGDASPRSPHTFHLPVMGTAFSIDTPLRVAKFGISSVISLVDDVLIEQMRRYHCGRAGLPYREIEADEEDARAKRITAYLDLIDSLVQEQVKELQSSPFEEGSEITRYFEMLPETPLKEAYRRMCALPEGPEKKEQEEDLRPRAVPGSIDVNIMTKVDRTVYRKGQPLPPEYCEAMAALRGYASSTLSSSIVFSAGINPRLYSYTSTFEDFLPDESGRLRKKIILKVSDYRSAVIQGKYLAKRGLWVSEFRIESGLNCGGHAFATNGYLTGPILEEFKKNRSALLGLLQDTYSGALKARGMKTAPQELSLSVQGGIGDAGEHEFLLTCYHVDRAGWGTPFLLCPDVTTVDDEHLLKLTGLQEGDVYLSDGSPLGLSFWNLRTSASEEARRARISAGRPGSSCPKGHLKFNTEFTKIPICLAARTYLKRKLDHLPEEGLTAEQLPVVREEILAKSCICHDLAGAATLKHGIDPSATPAICPGPNISYFNRIASLEEMAGHIYGRLSLLAGVERPHMFIQELKIYVGYLRREVERYTLKLSGRKPKYFLEFRDNLLEGIDYYRNLAEQFIDEKRERFRRDLAVLKGELESILLPHSHSDP